MKPFEAFKGELLVVDGEKTCLFDQLIDWLMVWLLIHGPWFTQTQNTEFSVAFMKLSYF